MFERTAEAAKWPKEQWTFFLGPYLSGKALAALKALEKTEAASYKELKRAILDRYEITPETYRQRLRAPSLPEGVRPRVIATRLKDVATRWLKPTTDDGRRIVDMIVMEQILGVLPAWTRHWLACWRSKRLMDFLELWDNFSAAEGCEGYSRGDASRGRNSGPYQPPRPGGDPGLRGRTRPRGGHSGFRGAGPPPLVRGLRSPLASPRRPGEWPAARDPGNTGTRGPEPGPCFRCGQWGHWKQECPLMECDWAGDPAGWDEAWQAVGADDRPAPWILDTYFEGTPWPALLDSGSSVSMVRSALLPSQLPVVRVTCIACFHGHVECCPVEEIPLYYLGQPRRLQVARVRCLPYLVLLERDAPAFKEALASFAPPEEDLAAPTLVPVPAAAGPSNAGMGNRTPAGCRVVPAPT